LRLRRFLEEVLTPELGPFQKYHPEVAGGVSHFYICRSLIRCSNREY